MPSDPPDYRRIAGDIERKIRDGEWPPGFELPTLVEQATEYGVSVDTVKKAHMLLKERGLLRGHQGRGVYVADSPPST